MKWIGVVFLCITIVLITACSDQSQVLNKFEEKYSQIPNSIEVIINQEDFVSGIMVCDEEGFDIDQQKLEIQCKNQLPKSYYDFGEEKSIKKETRRIIVQKPSQFLIIKEKMVPANVHFFDQSGTLVGNEEIKHTTEIVCEGPTPKLWYSSDPDTMINSIKQDCASITDGVLQGETMWGLIKDSIPQKPKVKETTLDGVNVYEWNIIKDAVLVKDEISWFFDMETLNPIKFVYERQMGEVSVGNKIVKDQVEKMVTTFELIELNKNYLPETFTFSSKVKTTKIKNLPECTDTDDGFIIKIKGTTTAPNMPNGQTDICHTGKNPNTGLIMKIEQCEDCYLRESYCNDDSVAVSDVDCSNCKDGVCIE